MPKGKSIYDVFSKKINNKAKRKKKAQPPAEVNNFSANYPTFAKSRNQHPKPNEKPRQISEAEAKPTVNSNTDHKKFIHKPAPKIKSQDPGIAAIKPVAAKEKKPRGFKKKNSKTGRKPNA